jgi:hypothetical protein
MVLNRKKVFPINEKRMGFRKTARAKEFDARMNEY